MKKLFINLGISLSTLLLLPTQAAVFDTYGGTYAGWPSSWNSIPGINDANNGLSASHLDFVGDANNPGGYWASDPNYMYLRIRVAASNPSTSTFHNSAILALIDNDGNGSPNYAFAWDMQQNHGLELTVPGSIGSTWATSYMLDRDGSTSQKTADDINTSGEGYIRVTTQQPTTSLGLTTFIDMSVSWDYLRGNDSVGQPISTLEPNQTWRIQFGSITPGNDHGFIAYDVAGGFNPTDPGLTWSGEFTPVPEPTATAAVFVGSCLLAAGWKRSRRRRLNESN
ncbi:MAG TPA: hypothetical protein P5055_02455 [Candidatus Paceibacterota bacterium]|nr:hypothetical protein [Candidatus Paceibacterota bacterium]